MATIIEQIYNSSAMCRTASIASTASNAVVPVYATTTGSTINYWQTGNTMLCEDAWVINNAMQQWSVARSTGTTINCGFEEDEWTSSNTPGWRIVQTSTVTSAIGQTRTLSNNWVYNPVQHVGDRLREILKLRQSPTIISPRKAMKPVSDVREVRARETLRRVLGADLYRGFLKNGFVSVKGKSGRVYQIFPGQDFTRVFENGKALEELCVVLNEQYPPTDSLLMRYVILLNDEDKFRSLANRHRAYERARFTEKVLAPMSLSETMLSLRKSGVVNLKMLKVA